MATSIVTSVREKLHTVYAKLYSADNLLDGTGKYFARTAHGASLTWEDVCAALFNRGGFEGSYNALTDNVRQFIDELVYQLLDAHSINLGYFTIYLKITGQFSSASEPYNKSKNPIKTKLRERAKLRRLIDEIGLVIEGVADTSGIIIRYVDSDEGSTNGIFVPGNGFKIYGKKLLIAGDNPNNGLFFIPADNSGPEVKVNRIFDNTSTRIIGIAPHTGFPQCRLLLRTQFSGSGGILLKEPRTIISPFILEEV